MLKPGAMRKGRARARCRRKAQRQAAGPERRAPGASSHPARREPRRTSTGARGALRRRAVVGLATAALLLPLGCGAGSQNLGPKQVLRRYGEALAAGRVGDAHRLLSAEARQRVSREEFERMVAENPQEMRDIASDLMRSSVEAEVRATAVAADGSRLELVLEGGQWKVEGSALDLYAQHTPRAALESFVRAFNNRRFDVLMSFVPDAQRKDLDEKQLEAAWEGEQREQMQKITQALEASLPALRVELAGRRATVGYGAGATVEMINEGGNWKIEDF